MIQSCSFLVPTTDLAGSLNLQPDFSQLCHRIQTLVQRYISIPHLHDRLQDLPHQFQQPQPRPWKTIDWQAVHPNQLLGIDLPVFLAILQGTIDTEAPIRGYTQASRQYLESLYPPMARFVGGEVDATGRVTELGLWEKEERQHTPALVKLYTQLAKQKPLITPHQARPYHPPADSYSSLYRHGLSRVATEYGATCLYLWMMAHTTGQLQAVLEELLQDEINHMTKFWGFGVWAFPDTSFLKVSQTFATACLERFQNPQSSGSLLHTLQRMMTTLNWSAWSGINHLTFFYTFGQVMGQLWQWHQELTPQYLESLLGEP